MCGFLVITNNNGKFSKDEFRNLVKFNIHRGPDETKIKINNNFLIGFNRLSINNIRHGAQPYVSKKDNLMVCFNGEIFNYKELVDQMSNNSIKVKSEIEAIYYLYKHYKQTFVKYLRGFFSICILDYKTKKIFVANDRFSIKPLYYGKLKNGEFFVTSDYSPLVKKNYISKELNYPSIQKYLTQGIIERDTFFKNVSKLRPAEYGFLNIKNNLKIFWKPKFNEEDKKIQDFDILFKDTINRWKKSEVHTSLSLSDGVDSQLINKYFEKLKIKSKRFTLIPNYKTINLKKLNIKTKMIKFSTKKSIKYLNNYYKISSIPLSNSSDLSFFFIYDEISKNRNIKVNFIGEGADEIFGGYDRYKLFLTNRINYISKMKKNEKFIKSIFKYYKSSKSDLLENFKSVNEILKFDQMKWLPSVVMRHDLIGMMFSIESRPIFLDNEIVDFANRLSIKNKISKVQTKIFLKKLCELKEVDYLNEKKGTPNYFITLSKDNLFKKTFKELLKKSRIINEIIDINLYLKKYSPDNFVYNWRIYNLVRVLNT